MSAGIIKKKRLNFIHNNVKGRDAHQVVQFLSYTSNKASENPK